MRRFFVFADRAAYPTESQCTSSTKHDAENRGANPRDRVGIRPHFLRRAHRDWRVWCAVMLMLAMVVVYVMTMDLSWRPGGHARPPMPMDNPP